MYKIYFNDKPVILSSKETLEYRQQENTLFYEGLNIQNIQQLIHQIHQPQIKSAVFLHNSEDELFQLFKNEFSFIQAAGGLVYSSQKNLLLIFRRGKWDLPKGKIDAGEDFETCTVREVKEETGLKNVDLQQPLTITYHTYREKENYILKECNWFLLFANEEQVLTPQIEEDIEKCEWVSLHDLNPYLEKAHQSVKDVINTGIKEMNKNS
ncbi:MAG: NUDIX hydrolase [Chitinophagaceae bacterium]